MNNSDQKFRAVVRDIICDYQCRAHLSHEAMARYLHISTRAYMAQEHGDYGFSAKTLASFFLVLPFEERGATLETIRTQMEWPDHSYDARLKAPPRRIDHLLRFLGATPHYKGYWYAKYGLTLICKNTEYLHAVSKWLYPEIARHFNTSSNAVERNIRTIAHIAWKTNRQRLEAIAGHPIPQQPTASHFLAILFFWLENSESPFI
ncbi:MAG: sporulation initiation factor Spo0A C-terminal domain-containing protein [Clostridiales bacterium]|nr:sporulation initiation factor Spo0A C-terminal domain-containing protein [Clostridiales bacterium]